MNKPTGQSSKSWIFFYQNGCNCRTLKKTCRLYSTVCGTTEQEVSGVIDKLMTVLHEQVREQVKKKKPSGQRWSSSTHQAVQNSCNAVVDSKGFCFYKAINMELTPSCIGHIRFPSLLHKRVSDDREWMLFFLGLFPVKNRQIFPRLPF